jgi:hypothetical protein
VGQFSRLVGEAAAVVGGVPVVEEAAGVAELQAAAITATEARTTAVPATVRRRRAGLIEVRGRRVDMVIELLCQGDPG